MPLPTEWQRFTYWMQQGENLPATLQALCAIATVILTFVLVLFTKKYVQLTRELASSSQRSLRLLVQPNLDLKSEVESVLGTVPPPRARAQVSITNKGAYPVLISRGVVSWRNEDSGESEERELPGLRNRVVPAGESVAEEMWISERDGSPIEIEHLDSFSDFFTLTISCRDLGGLCRYEFSYQPATGLSYTEIE
jgi:hypothetical protein